jgi:hypothetical protein
MSIQDEARDFIQQAEQAQQGLLRELWEWLRFNKKWWLTPVVVMLLIVGGLVILSGTAVAPFIYTLF